MNQAQSVSEFLSAHLNERNAKNPRYSARAFARDCGVSTASISLILRGKAKLSKLRAGKVAKNLSLSDEKRDYLVVLAEYENARTEQAQRAAMLKRLKYMSHFVGIERDRYQLISGWYHLPIFELVETRGFRESPKWIASQLGITEQEAADALERLLRLGFLQKKNGTIEKAMPSVVIPDGAYSEHLRATHRSFLELAIDSVSRQSAAQSFQSSTVIRCRKSDIAGVLERAREFRQGVMVDLEKGDDREFIYLLGIQFFQLNGVNDPASSP